ncbi:MAG TPA: hypothetical protein PKH39_16055, partial [Woeseiaceae bacterium]|nr:hypothetical protein [Woeseiaceae bacterium]
VAALDPRAPRAPARPADVPKKASNESRRTGLMIRRIMVPDAYDASGDRQLIKALRVRFSNLPCAHSLASDRTLGHCVLRIGDGNIYMTE